MANHSSLSFVIMHEIQSEIGGQLTVRGHSVGLYYDLEGKTLLEARILLSSVILIYLTFSFDILYVHYIYKRM